MSTTRRGFLSGAAAAAIKTVWVHRTGAAVQTRPANKITLGFSLYGMKSLKPAEAIRACHRIGYDAVELTLTPGWPTEPRLLSAGDRSILRGLLEDLELTLASLMEHLSLLVDDKTHQNNLDRLKAAAEVSHMLSPGAPPIIETVVGGKSHQWEQVRNQMADRLASWAKVAANTRTVIAVKPHVGGALHTPEGAIWLLDQVSSPWIKLVYDYSHFALIGRGLSETIAKMIPRSVLVHVKDSKLVAGKPRFLLPGDGKVDYVKYLELLRAAGYTGSVVVEVSSQIHNKPGYNPIAAAEHCYANLSRAFEKEGIKRR